MHGSADQILHRAFEYPYERPSGHFTFDTLTGAVERLHQLDSSGRIPVLAIGSNAAPEQLARKFDPVGRFGSIPARPRPPRPRGTRLKHRFRWSRVM